MAPTERPEAFPAAEERREKGRTVSRRRATRNLAGKGPENLCHLRFESLLCCHLHVLQLCDCPHCFISYVKT
jgi:hypothetical protein